MPDRVFTIVNPVAGQPEPVLAVLAGVWSDAGVSWDLALTEPDRSASEILHETNVDEFDVVAVYGGDGTVGAAAQALRHASVPLLILPGGTGNVVARALGIPADLGAAAELIASRRRRAIDALEIDEGESLSLLRLGYGADAATISGASRSAKSDLGWLAYLGAATASAVSAPRVRYHFELDGQEHELDGVALSICNVGRIGRTRATIHPEIVPDDGTLDVVVVKTLSAPIVEIAARHLPSGQDSDTEGDDSSGSPKLRHLKGTSFRWLTAPESECHVDGEIREASPRVVRCVPGAVRVVVPDSD